MDYQRDQQILLFYHIYHVEAYRWIDGRLESYALKWTWPMINAQIKRISVIYLFTLIEQRKVLCSISTRWRFFISFECKLALNEN